MLIICSQIFKYWPCFLPVKNHTSDLHMYSFSQSWFYEMLEKYWSLTYFSGNPRSSTTPCWPRPESIIIRETITNWEPLVVNISVYVPSRLQILAIRISSDPCHKERLKKWINMNTHINTNWGHFFRLSFYDHPRSFVNFLRASFWRILHELAFRFQYECDQTYIHE